MKNFILFCSALFITASVCSQDLGERTKDRAESKANQRVDQKIDNALDDGFDAIEGLFKKKSKNNKKDAADEPEMETSNTEQDNTEVAADDAGPGVDMSALFGSSEPLPEKYEFDHRVKLKMTNTDKKDQQVMYMDMLFSKTEPIIGMQNVEIEGEKEQADVNMIIDLDTRKMVTLTNSEGTKMAMTINMDAAKFKDSEDEQEVKFTKTGKTKEILGYTCEEYTYDSKDASGNFWVTDEVDLNMDDAFFMMAKNKKTVRPSQYPEGFFMEMNSSSKDGKTTTKMEVTEFEKDSNTTISTAGYKQFGFGK